MQKSVTLVIPNGVAERLLNEAKTNKRKFRCKVLRISIESLTVTICVTGTRENIQALFKEAQASKYLQGVEI